MHINNEQKIEKIYTLAKNKAISLFGKRLITVYLIGSLSHGGFSYTASDIDVAFILDGDITDNDWEKFSLLEKYIKKSNLEFSDRLSVFWSTLNVLSNEVTSGAFPVPNKTQGVFPPFDILDLYQNGTLIYGKDIRNKIKVPDSNLLFVSGVEFLLSYVNTTERNKYLKDKEAFLNLDPVKISKTILFPTRLLYTLLTGKIGSNDDAVSYFFVKGSLDKNTKLLIEEAMLIRNMKGCNKKILQDCHQYLKNHYIELIDLNKNKMIELGNEKYALMLDEWKKGIQG